MQKTDDKGVVKPYVLTNHLYVKSLDFSDERILVSFTDLDVATYNQLSTQSITLVNPVYVGSIPGLSPAAYIVIRDVYVAINFVGGINNSLYSAELLYQDVAGRLHSLGIVDAFAISGWVFGLANARLALVASAPIQSGHPKNAGSIILRTLSSEPDVGVVISAEIMLNVSVTYVSAD